MFDITSFLWSRARSLVDGDSIERQNKYKNNLHKIVTEIEKKKKILKKIKINKQEIPRLTKVLCLKLNIFE